ncbi:hypothetical protein M899_1383 [Bacteriovorax sp. BSW11_IV]|uniref:hypothetical protein n=1 Tax=Bacteriovorax sp. BSW11_IV TaxID=1353529 RepID=UPI00038A2EAC|nr:hypothetical protein [Bacteriovorax sp. BSW11_IV]EQC45922.1 hypothetical protein M899_1383 [Bacteriovorax sp. BSW11_IV]
MNSINENILISGITFIKNGLTLGYPIKESIESIDALCDEIIVNVGFNNPECTEDDGTWDYLTKNFTGPKFKFLKSWWNPDVMSKGLILSEQTNIALEAATGKYCQYIQGDECLHEDDLELIRSEVKKLDQEKDVDGLVFKYVHFYGNTNIQKVTKKTYRQEVRLIRNGVGIKSWLDAQGFRKADDSKLLCKKINATVYHYGWARAEQVMNKKTEAFNKLYHGKDFKSEEVRYSRIWGLRPFTKSHPKVMAKWIEDNKNEIDILSLPLDFKWGDIRLMLSDSFEHISGIRLGEYKNFKLKG